MRSFDLMINAINNLATSINKLADSNKKTSIDPLPKTTTSNPYSANVNVTSSYSVNNPTGWFSLTSAEKEQLYYIYKALIEKGVNPNYHDNVYDKFIDNLRNNWPSLHKPIEKLISLKEKNILNNKYSSYDQNIWKKKNK